MRFHSTGFTMFVWALLPGMIQAQTPDPLRLIPEAADAVAKVEDPRALYDAIYQHEIFQDFLKMDAVAAF